MRVNVETRVYEETPLKPRKSGKNKVAYLAAVWPASRGNEKAPFDNDRVVMLKSMGLSRKVTWRSGQETETYVDQTKREWQRLKMSARIGRVTMRQGVRCHYDMQELAFASLLDSVLYKNMSRDEILLKMSCRPNVFTHRGQSYITSNTPPFAFPKFVGMSDVIYEFGEKGLAAIGTALDLTKSGKNTNVLLDLADEVENRELNIRKSETLVRKEFYREDDSVGLF